jgi:FKBP-type peptidyl-prolyl cis-trans isomerase FklB
MFGRLKTVIFVFGIGLMAVSCFAQVPQEAGSGTQEAGSGTTEVPGLQPNASITTPEDAESLQDKASLIIGFSTISNLINNLERQGVELNDAKFSEGIQKALQGEELGMTTEETQSVMMAFQKIAQKQQVEKMTMLAKKNKAEGDAFLAENAKNANVKTLPTGVQYEILEEGTGGTPTVSNLVRVHYHGTLPDGTVFDSTLQPRNGKPPEPVEFMVNQVVPGFSATLQAMKVGGKWKVAIPGDQAYAMKGKGKIGPNQTLVFEIQLLGVVR